MKQINGFIQIVLIALMAFIAGVVPYVMPFAYAYVASYLTNNTFFGFIVFVVTAIISVIQYSE